MNRPTKRQIRICHFSDLHLPLPEPAPLWRLVGKRCLGYPNLKFIRGKTYRLDAFEPLLEQMAGEQADLVVMTGDLSSLAFGFEFKQIDRLFRRYGLTPDTTVVLPGNHDRYTIGADLTGAFEKGMAPWLATGFDRDGGYPISTTVGPVTVYALDTARWRNPVRAAGYIAPNQILRLLEKMESDSSGDTWPVIAMHHPPFHLAPARLRDYRNGLDGLDRFIDALKTKNATVLHGHLHKFSRRQINGLDVIGVPSASNDSGTETSQLAYHVYTFAPEGLVKAEAVRHWPRNQTPQTRFERIELPGEAVVS